MPRRGGMLGDEHVVSFGREGQRQLEGIRCISEPRPGHRLHRDEAAVARADTERRALALVDADVRGGSTGERSLRRSESAGSSTPATSASSSPNEVAKERRSRSPPFVSSATATPASGTTRRNAACPIVPPSCPTTVRPFQCTPTSRGPSGLGDPVSAARHLDLRLPHRARGRLAQRPLPSAAAPPSRCSRANATSSRRRRADPSGRPGGARQPPPGAVL